MLVAHLIGGNQIQGINKGKVFVDGVKLKERYEDLVQVCGNISLGDTDLSRSDSQIEREYIQLVNELGDEDIEDAKKYVVDNFLAKSICYSEYVIDFENKSLVLKIDVHG